jgi:hypothetical protein
MLQAMVTDASLNSPLPRLALNDIQGLADLIEQRFIRSYPPGSAGKHPKASNPKPNLPDHR